jgi:hypothetical protein
LRPDACIASPLAYYGSERELGDSLAVRPQCRHSTCRWSISGPGRRSLASDGTDSGVVAQFEAMAPTGLKDRPRLRAFAALHWLRRVASGSEQLSARVIDALGVLAKLVRQHRSSGGTMLDSTPSLLEPDMRLDLRVRVCPRRHR